MSATSNPITLQDTFIYDLDNIGIDYPKVTSNKGLEIDASVYIVDGQGATPEMM